MKIYLINVGANLAHQANAKSPRFSDGSFTYVPFPHMDGHLEKRPYPAKAWPFTNNLKWHQTHDDPDWENLTYGDNLSNPRASALAQVEDGDILLFWALLWENHGDSWFTFSKDRSWHVIGALRVEEVLWPGTSLRDVSPRNRERVRLNAHFQNKRLGQSECVFIGDKQHSQLFRQAVPLVRNLTKSSLLYRIFRTSAGERLPLNGKHWSSYLRSCRMICDLDSQDGRGRAKLIRDAVSAQNSFDLLKDLL